MSVTSLELILFGVAAALALWPVAAAAVMRLARWMSHGRNS